MASIINDRNGLPLYLGDRVSYTLSSGEVLIAEIKISDNPRLGDHMLFVIRTSAYAQSHWGTEVGKRYYFFGYDNMIYWEKKESPDWWEIWGVK